MGEEKSKSESESESKNKKLMDCVPWVACFFMMRVTNKTPPTSKRWMGNEILKITQVLADEDTTAILLVGSEEVGDKVKIET